MSNDAPTPRRRGRPARDDVREEVLAAAERLLRTVGLESITVADLLEASGVSRATFYKHFAGRDDVIAELYVDHVNHARMEVVKAIVGTNSLYELLAKATRAYLKVIHGRGPLTREFSKLCQSNEKMRQVREEIVYSYGAAVNAIQQQHGEMQIPDYVIEAFVAGIESMGHRIGERTDIEPTDEGLNEVMRELAAATVALFSVGERSREQVLEDISDGE